MAVTLQENLRGLLDAPYYATLSLEAYADRNRRLSDQQAAVFLKLAGRVFFDVQASIAQRRSGWEIPIQDF